MSELIINGCTASGWSDDLFVANEFLKASAKLRGDGSTLCLRNGTIEYEMFQSLTPRQHMLVKLGEHLGGPMKGITIKMEVAA
jgi:hypothetical protein